MQDATRIFRPPPAERTPVCEFAKLAQLYDAGVIAADEFDARRADLFRTTCDDAFRLDARTLTLRGTRSPHPPCAGSRV
ncbi:SHOCT domain-containing protein [Microbacter sp. GSS18]|nr:SHOCT domain-containing protein [Microbacter sp. GSS18]